jgi:hypothetical protein
MAMSVDIDCTDLLKEFEKIPLEIVKCVRRELKNQTDILQRDARNNHRYKHRTGMLRKSTEKKFTNDDLQSEVYLDSGIASYGKFVHDGQRSWEPDQFIYNAADKLRGEIETALERAVNEGIQMGKIL